MTRISVVGGSGRLGGALVRSLGATSVSSVVRSDRESAPELAQRATRNADVVVNAAGLAHIEGSTDDKIDQLLQSNVELPLALAAACLDAGVPLVHVSSVKANDPGSSPYARSKRDGDDRLEAEFGGRFTAAGLTLVIVRPLALLIPPFDAGRLARLRWLSYVPRRLVPTLRVPATGENRIIGLIDDLAIGAASGGLPHGFVVVEAGPADRATLRDVRDVMKHQAVHPS